MDALDIIFNKSGFRPAVFTSHSKASLGGYGGGAGGGCGCCWRLSACPLVRPRRSLGPSCWFPEWLVRVGYLSGLSESVF